MSRKPAMPRGSTPRRQFLQRSATTAAGLDPVKEEFPTDAQANRCLARAEREPWQI